MQKLLNYNVFLTVKVLLSLANSEHSDEITPIMAFHTWFNNVYKSTRVGSSSTQRVIN